jgi:hypothetical protein
MPLERSFSAAQAADGWLWNDCLQQGCNELLQDTPAARRRQAACVQWGESSKSRASGSSSRMIKR